MSMYRTGLAQPAVLSRSTYGTGISPNVGGVIATLPGEFSTMMGRIWSEIVATDRQMNTMMSGLKCQPTKIVPNQSSQCTALYNHWAGPWSSFVNDYDLWKQSHSGWWSRFWMTVDDVAVWQKRLAVEYAAAQKAGFTFTGAPPTEADPTLMRSMLDGVIKLIKWLLIGAAGVAGIYLAYQMIKSVSGRTA